MREVYLGFLGRKVLFPFINSGEEMKNFPEISKDDIGKLNDTVEKVTAAKTYAESQKILDEYVKGIDAKNPANIFYGSMLGMLLNSRRDVHNSETL